VTRVQNPGKRYVAASEQVGLRLGAKMTERLAVLIEMARTVQMTAPDQEEQRRSFAYGNTKIENDRITREMVDQEAEALKRASGG